LKEDELKARLMALKKGQATWQQEHQQQVLHAMLAHIGSTEVSYEIHGFRAAFMNGF
jgi:hypothetical protein